MRDADPISEYLHAGFSRLHVTPACIIVDKNIGYSAPSLFVGNAV